MKGGGLRVCAALFSLPMFVAEQQALPFLVMVTFTAWRRFPWWGCGAFRLCLLRDGVAPQVGKGLEQREGQQGGALHRGCDLARLGALSLENLFRRHAIAHAADDGARGCGIGQADFKAQFSRFRPNGHVVNQPV